MKNIIIIAVTFVVSFFGATAVFDSLARALGLYDPGLYESQELYHE